MVEISKDLIFFEKTTSLNCQMKGILKALLVKFAIMKRAQDSFFFLKEDSCVKIFGEMLHVHKVLMCSLSDA